MQKCKACILAFLHLCILALSRFVVCTCHRAMSQSVKRTSQNGASARSAMSATSGSQMDNQPAPRCDETRLGWTKVRLGRDDA